ncbi:hypothetical protein H4W80_000477 [Nonomuraea angiospora]|uniref:Uncharacterized protein n=1 Tax=Nonomuraea angiospora TaxID=46172 RepID=A0ABR9LNI3_9ACTN|nr:hypothetical protein [Nonomuraea angiospora]
MAREAGVSVLTVYSVYGNKAACPVPWPMPPACRPTPRGNSPNWRRRTRRPGDIYAGLCNIDVYTTLTTERGWSPDRVEQWWGDILARELLN